MWYDDGLTCYELARVKPYLLLVLTDCFGLVLPSLPIIKGAKFIPFSVIIILTIPNLVDGCGPPVFSIHRSYPRLLPPQPPVLFAKVSHSLQLDTCVIGYAITVFLLPLQYSALRGVRRFAAARCRVIFCSWLGYVDVGFGV